MGAAARLRRRTQLNLALLAAPALLLFLVFFAVPVVRLLGLSLSGGSTQWFARALGEPLYRDVFALTFGISAAVTALTLLLGYPVAWFLATTTRRWRAAGFLMIMLPLWTSVLVRTYAWMVLLGRNGVINKSLLAMGVIEQPLPLLYNLFGVLVGMVHVLLPFMVLPLYSAMQRIDPSLLQAARGLGAPSARVLLRIVLPLTLTGVAAGTVLVFITSLGFFITPALLGGGKVMMIAVLIQQQVGEVLDWNFAAALSALLLAVTVAIYGLVQAAIERRPGAAA